MGRLSLLWINVTGNLILKKRIRGEGEEEGGAVSKNLFNCVLEEIFLNLDWETKGINGGKLNNPKFADDVLLIEKDTRELEEITKGVSKNE